MLFSLRTASGDFQHIIHDLTRNIHPAQGLHSMEFQGVIDLVDQVASFGVFNQVNRQHAAADCLRRAQA